LATKQAPDQDIETRLTLRVPANMYMQTLYW